MLSALKLSELNRATELAQAWQRHENTKRSNRVIDGAQLAERLQDPESREYRELVQFLLSLPLGALFELQAVMLIGRDGPDDGAPTFAAILTDLVKKSTVEDEISYITSKVVLGDYLARGKVRLRLR